MEPIYVHTTWARRTVPGRRECVGCIVVFLSSEQIEHLITLFSGTHEMIDKSVWKTLSLHCQDDEDEYMSDCRCTHTEKTRIHVDKLEIFETIIKVWEVNFHSDLAHRAMALGETFEIDLA
jgi:hypothetical protein